MAGVVDVIVAELDETGEASLAAWLKDVGDAVAEGEILAEVMLDKANVEVVSPAAGRLTARLVAEGESVKPGQPIARIETR